MLLLLIRVPFRAHFEVNLELKIDLKISLISQPETAAQNEAKVLRGETVEPRKSLIFIGGVAIFRFSHFRARDAPNITF